MRSKVLGQFGQFGHGLCATPVADKDHAAFIGGSGDGHAMVATGTPGFADGP